MAIISIGMGSITRRPIAPVRIGGMGNRRRGLRGLGQFPGAGADQASCPSGQWNSNLQTCCAPGDGSVPASEDPCSILNTPGYDQEQAAVQQQAIQGAAGNASSTLAQLVGYSQPVQTAALTCVSNPGLTYTDNWGYQVTCPSLEVDDNGIEVSAYTPQQLAAMIQPTYATTLPSNAYAGTTVAPPNAVAASAPTNVTVTPAPKSNALSNSAGQTNNGSGVTPAAIANTSNVTGNSSNAQGGAPASDVTIGGVDVTSWIEQNWVILAAAAVGLIVVLPMLEKR